MKPRRLIFFLFLALFSCQPRHMEFHSSSLSIMIGKSGHITSLNDPATGKNYLYADTTVPLLQVRWKGKLLQPVGAKYNVKKNLIELYFPNHILAHVRAREYSSHVSFLLESLTGLPDIDLVMWGPYATTLGGSIGETVGIAGDNSYTIGLQALNPKTLGGYPWTENDCMPQIDIFEQSDLSDLSEAGKRGVLYRVEAAKPEPFGSTLQAYCRNRDRDRLIDNWDHQDYLAPAYDDGGVPGSSIALFGCPTLAVLTTIGEIETTEGLPHPMIDGVWGKESPTASAAYLIMPFGESTIDQAIEATKKAGLRYLYHPDAFETWGHFTLKKSDFPHGIEGLRQCSDRAAEQGIMLGVHVLSNFITTNDPYVTPVPDRRLAKVGSSRLAGTVDASQTEIAVESIKYFSQFTNNNLRTARVSDELIQYDTVSSAKPWKLLGCRRGAFGTVPSAHASGDTISLLADHGYKVFLTNAELTKEIAARIADLFNRAGLRQISFDGLEGNRSTGMGNYGEILFTTTWYKALNDTIRRHYIADASRTSHYFWHIYTRMNWGEPWYAGFRESQTDYRLKNQEYFRRNLMPGMLGWFNMTPETSPADIEWMLARSAAYDAGFAFCTSFGVLEKNPHSNAILSLIATWEEARMAGFFSKEQKEQMKDIHKEFHLVKKGSEDWSLIPADAGNKE